MTQAAVQEAHADTLWNVRFAQRLQGVGSSVIREMLKITEQPEVISFAGGLPAPEIFPVAEIQAAARRVLDDHGPVALQYSTTEGYLPLRELLVRHMARYGIHVGPDNVLITSGSQQALDLIGKLLLNPGDLVLTEAPTFLGAIQAFTAYQAQFVTAPIDDEGVQGGLFLWVTLPPGLDSSDLLKDALARKVAFVPGAPFFPAGGGTGTFRLNFSYCSPDRIEEGIARLGAVLRERLGDSGTRESGFAMLR